jgi:hypothetical protein
MGNSTRKLKRELSELSARLRTATNYGDDEPAGEYFNEHYRKLSDEVNAIRGWAEFLAEPDRLPMERQITLRNIEVHSGLLAELARTALNDDYHLYEDDEH